MTLAELRQEILSRCGEGYENWTDRAYAIFKTAVFDLVKSGEYEPYDYHGLIFTSHEELDIGTTEVLISKWIGEYKEYVSCISMKRSLGSQVTKIDIVPQTSVLMGVLNPELLTGVTQWVLTSTAVGKFLSYDLVEEIETVDMVLIVWDNEVMRDAGAVVSDYYSTQFLNAVIDQSVRRIIGEVKQ